MSRSGRRGSGKKSSSGKSIIQVVPPASPAIPRSSKQRFSIDWKQVNFVQFVIIFSCFLFFVLFIIIPVLNEYGLLRPHTNALTQILSSALLALATILSVGLIYVQKVKIWQSFKPRQIRFDIGISALAIVVVLVSIVQFPSSSPHLNLSRIPYPPYQQGNLVVDGMQSNPSSRYYWEQRTEGQASCKFVGSDYHVATTKQNRLAWCDLVNSDFRNFALEIDMSFLKPGIASIYFQRTNQASYELDIQSEGDYADLSFGVLSGFGQGKLHYRAFIQSMLIVAREGPIIFSPGSTNRIALVVIDQTINFYVNGLTTQSWQRTDDSSSHGSIAVAAYTPSDQQDAQTEVIFSNVRTWIF